MTASHHAECLQLDHKLFTKFWFRNNGEIELLGRYNIKDSTGVKDLFYVWNLSHQLYPYNGFQRWTNGLCFKNENLYLNAFFDVLDRKTLTAESTYLRNGTCLFGTRAVWDLDSRQLKNCEQGLVWDRSKNSQAGIRHEANCTQGNFKWGMLSFMLHWTNPNKT